MKGAYPNANSIPKLAVYSQAVVRLSEYRKARNHAGNLLQDV